MKARARLTVAGRPSSWRAAAGIVLVYAGVDLLANAVRLSYREGWHHGSDEQIQLCKETHYDDEPSREKAGEPGDGPSDAAGPS